MEGGGGVPAWAVPPSQQQQQQQPQQQGYNPQQQQQQQNPNGYQNQHGYRQQTAASGYGHHPPSAPSSGGVPRAPSSGGVPNTLLIQQQQQQQRPHHITPPSSGNAPPSIAGMAQQRQQPTHHPAPAAVSATTTTGSTSRQFIPPSKNNTNTKKNNKRPSRTELMEQKVLVTRTADEETEDGRIRNKEAISKIRDAWVYKQIRARVDEFTQYKQALLYIGTWNVNAKGKEEGLDEWICSDWGPNGEYAPDIVAVGFQEIVDLNAVNVAVDNKTQQRSQYWVDRLRQTLNTPQRTQNDPQNRGYALLMQRSMVGLLICVFVKAPHRGRVKYISSDSVGVGVMGMMGNKGGVAIRMQFYDSTMCFVCSHLAAHRENVAGRNADYVNVLGKLSFDVGEDAVREVIRNGSMSQWASGSSAVGIADHDTVFWLGDLNYRIDESMPTERVMELCEAKQLNELRPLDQLVIERNEGRSFQGFEEGPLNFVPTYKYQPGTDIYEQRPEKKLRAPAWCDRILWMAQESPSHVQQLTYDRSETPNISDHKPVYSTMRITIKDVLPDKREAIYQELMQLLDRYENQSLPMVGLDRSHLDFGPVRYGQSVSLPIHITNTGNVAAQFRLVPKLDENSLCKSWMTVFPTYGMLLPGEAPTAITVTVTIDNTTSQLLNSGREVLDDILILRLENGRDYYITIQATYARSCYGMPLDELVLYSDPIREIPIDAIQRAENEKYDINPTQALCVPKELWRLVDAIYEKGLQEADIFVTHGNPDEIAAIRECLDTGAPFVNTTTTTTTVGSTTGSIGGGGDASTTSPTAASTTTTTSVSSISIHSYVDAFLSFLISLASPVVNPALFPTVEIDAQNIQVASRRFLEFLPPIHYNVFVYVISFFREALLYRESNKLTAAKLARICLKCCAPVPSSTSMYSTSSGGSGAGTAIAQQGGGNQQSSTGGGGSSSNQQGQLQQQQQQDSTSVQRRAGMQLILLHLLETSSI